MKRGSPKVLESAPIPNFKSIFMIGQLPEMTLHGLPLFATPRYDMGVFKTGKIKTGFPENLGQCSLYPECSTNPITGPIILPNFKQDGAGMVPWPSDQSVRLVSVWSAALWVRISVAVFIEI